MQERHTVSIKQNKRNSGKKLILQVCRLTLHFLSHAQFIYILISWFSSACKSSWHCQRSSFHASPEQRNTDEQFSWVLYFQPKAHLLLFHLYSLSPQSNHKLIRDTYVHGKKKDLKTAVSPTALHQGHLGCTFTVSQPKESYSMFQPLFDH